MKYFISFLVFIAVHFKSFGQCSTIHFTYNDAGNRVQRKQVSVSCLTSDEEDNPELALKILKPLSNNKPSTKMDMKAYPNPNNGHFDVVIDGLQENTVLELYDMKGRKVHSQIAKPETNQIDVSSLNMGAYILIGRTTDNAIGRLKVVIE
jgi:Secretion system C-terminal sorting domain